MSRTDKTSPYIVKLWHGALRREAWHDHALGDCDLPPTLRTTWCRAIPPGAAG